MTYSVSATETMVSAVRRTDRVVSVSTGMA
jgi:hypothetical protein